MPIGGGAFVATLTVCKGNPTAWVAATVAYGFRGKWPLICSNGELELAGCRVLCAHNHPGSADHMLPPIGFENPAIAYRVRVLASWLTARKGIPTAWVGGVGNQ